MPLIQSSSDKARQANIETEIAAGKAPRQAVAIGYSVQRESNKRHDGHKDGHNEPKHKRG